MKYRVLILGLMMLVGSSLSCRGREQQESSDVMKVFVSIAPQAFVVQRIGGKNVDVNVLVQPGREPHTFEPTPKQIAQLADSQAYFSIGVSFESRLVQKLKGSFKGVAIVDMSLDVGHNGENHDHDHECDPHTWLSPRLLKQQARLASEGLCRVDPVNAAEYRANLNTLCDELDQLDKQLAEKLAPLKGRTVYVFHPAFGHFVEAYGLKQKAVETGGKSPSLKSISELIDQARAEDVRVIFVQPQFSTKAAQSIARAIGGVVVPIDPLARDYITNMTRMADAIQKALSKPKGSKHG